MKKLAILMAFLLSGCVSSQSVANRLSSQYAGHNADQFFLDHSSPAKKFQLNSGDLIWTWDSGVSYSGGIMLQCIVELISTPDGTIKSVRIIKDTVGWWTTSMCSESL